MKKIDKIIEYIRAQGVEVDPGPEDAGWILDESIPIVWIGIPQSQAFAPDSEALRQEVENLTRFLVAKDHRGYCSGVFLTLNARNVSELEDAVLEDAHERLEVLALILGYERDLPLPDARRR